MPSYTGNPLYVIGYCELMLESNLGGVVPIPAPQPSLSLEELRTSMAAQKSNSDRGYAAQVSPGLNIPINEGRHSVDGPQYAEGGAGGSTEEGENVAIGDERVIAPAGQTYAETAATSERQDHVEGLSELSISKESGEQMPKSPNRTLFRHEA